SLESTRRSLLNPPRFLPDLSEAKVYRTKTASSSPQKTLSESQAAPRCFPFALQEWWRDKNESASPGSRHPESADVVSRCVPGSRPSGSKTGPAPERCARSRSWFLRISLRGNSRSDQGLRQ